MFRYGGTVTMRSASFKQGQTQFWAHCHLATCSACNRASGEPITGGEDRVARVFDPDSRILAKSARRDFSVSLVVSLPSAKLCFIGMGNRLSLTDNKPRLFNTITVAAGAAISVSPDRLP
jgi:hypothetical protein